MLVLNSLRKIKHRISYLPRAVSKDVERRKDNIFRFLHEGVPYNYSVEERLSDLGFTHFPTMSTMHLDSSLLWGDAEKGGSPAPRRIFLIWAGDNPLGAMREESIRSIKEANPDFEVVLIHAGNLSQWVIPESPLHPRYSDLSYTHRSDYLRAYLMHHYGGVYMDIKEPQGSWCSLIERLNADDQLWATGPSEQTSRNMASLSDPTVGARVGRNFINALCQYAYACKPGTTLTAEWFKEVNRRLDYLNEPLAEHPAHDAIGVFPHYPVPWNFLLGQFFPHLVLRYEHHIAIDNSMSLRLEGHRG